MAVITTYGPVGVAVNGIAVSVGASVATGITTAGCVSVAITTAVSVGAGEPNSWLAAKTPTPVRQSNPITTDAIIGTAIDFLRWGADGATGVE